MKIRKTKKKLFLEILKLLNAQNENFLTNQVHNFLPFLYGHETPLWSIGLQPDDTRCHCCDFCSNFYRVEMTAPYPISFEY